MSVKAVFATGCEPIEATPGFSNSAVVVSGLRGRSSPTHLLATESSGTSPTNSLLPWGKLILVSFRSL